MFKWEQEIDNIICPYCSSQSWEKPCAHQNRYNSMTATVSCADCEGKLFLKKINITPEVNNSIHEAQEQFNTLIKLREKFPSSDRFNTLFPINLNPESSCIATKFVLGSTLDNWLSNKQNTNIENTIFLCGKWLHLLHQAGTNKEIPNSIEEKLQVIQEIWSSYKLPTSVSKSITSLNKAATILSTKKCTGYWLHGDFTPNNILFDNKRLTGIDIGWDIQGIAEMDLAPFLNHVGIICNSFRGRHMKKLIPNLESAFLSGYFENGENDDLLLNWCRLYFLLSYRATNFNSFFRRVYSKLELDSITKEVTNRLDTLI